jgi:hypothetical protein
VHDAAEFHWCVCVQGHRWTDWKRPSAHAFGFQPHSSYINAVKNDEPRQESKPEREHPAHRLQTLRHALLTLHKSLVDSERVQYEKTIGKIRSPSHFLQLLTDDPWFAWLSPISRLIVSMDEALDGDEPLTHRAVDAFIKHAARLLKASDAGQGFSKHYYEALQRDPDVVMAHAGVTRVQGWPRRR